MKTPTTQAVMTVLRERINPGETVNLLAIGPLLVAQDFTEREILFALEYLHAHKQIEMISGNRVRLLVE